MPAATAAVDLPEEQQQIAAAQAGDLAALRPLLERLAGPLYGTVILPRTGDAASAEELLRDALATAVEKIGQFRWQGHGLYPWLRQIALNKVHDAHRQARRTRRLADALAHEVEPGSAPESHADARLMAEQERRAHRARIDATLARVHPRYRAAIELRLVEELPREACAARLEVSVGTFDVLLFRAVRAFRREFGARDAAPPSTSVSTSTSTSTGPLAPRRG